MSAALRWGADAVKYEAFPCGPAERETMSTLEALGRACDAAGLPLLAEVVPHSFEAVEHHTVEAVATAARMAMECGADMVKVPLPVDGGLEPVVRYAQVPVVVLGGPATTPDGFLGSARLVMEAGAAGLAVGRNVFEAPSPRRVTADLLTIIHGGNLQTNTPRWP